MSQETYVPALRWKPAERSALALLEGPTAKGVLPLIEPPPSILLNNEPSQALNNLARSIEQHWLRPFYVDPYLIGKHAPGFAALEGVTRACRARGLPIFPVLRPEASAEESSTVLATQGGQDSLALRVPAGERSLAHIHNLLERVRRFGIADRQLTLILDQGYLRDEQPSDHNVMLMSSIARWRTVVVLSGSFPVNLSGLSLDRHELTRHEVLRYCGLLDRWPPSLPLPVFGDYTIVHPHFKELKSPRPSVSVKYATERTWIVLKGQTLEQSKGRGYAQFVGHARFLVNDVAFDGSSYCPGDRYIAECAEAARPGNFKTWLGAGINRHLTVTARQMLAAVERWEQDTGAAG